MHYYFDKFKRLPAKLIIFIILTNLVGICVLYSANDGIFYYVPMKQLMSFIIFMIMSCFIALIDLKKIYNYSYILYSISAIILIAIYVFGYKAMGATRWVNIMGLKLQPSEIMKIGVVLLLARYYHDIKNDRINELRHMLFPAISCAIPAFLVMKQPDLGTGIIILLILGIIIFAVGMQIKQILYLVCPVILISPLLWHALYDYQKKRISMFLNPESDPLGSGYNIIQSKIAIGSGGMLGKGYLKGSQSHLNFLPEHHTDFVFAGLAEELGFVGSMILLGLYFVIILESLSIAINSRSAFGKILVIGIISIFFSHIVINISMVSGLLPVVGIPLPFFSYGRTMLGMMLIGFGLIMNVHVHQKANFVRQL